MVAAGWFIALVTSIRERPLAAAPRLDGRIDEAAQLRLGFEELGERARNARELDHQGFDALRGDPGEHAAQRFVLPVHRGFYGCCAACGRAAGSTIPRPLSRALT